MKTRAERPARSEPRAARREAPAAVSGTQAGDAQRLHKILAQAGVGSRRACELLILEGRVTVDGEVVRELGTKVDPSSAKIAVDGQRIKPEPNVYYLVHKPKGYVSTSDDPSGRPLVLDLVPRAKERIFIVGRLDRHSEGLMLLTNDGALAQRLTHPSFGVEKTYRVTVAGDAGHDVVDKLTEGVWLAEGKVRARRARIVAHRGNVTILEIVLAEGKNREIRRMLARLDHKVLSLLRVAIGPLQLKGLSEGEWRSLSASEVERLRTSTAAEDSEEPGERPHKRAHRAPKEAKTDRSSASASKASDRSTERTTGKTGKFGARPTARRPFERSEKPASSSRKRPEPDESPAEEEELVFTDRMDIEDRQARPESRRDTFRPRGDRPRGDRARADAGDRPQRREKSPGDRARADAGDRPQRREKSPGDRPRVGKPAGRGRTGISREDRPDLPKRSVLGQAREPGQPGPKRRPGPSRGLPPRRRRPKG